MGRRPGHPTEEPTLPAQSKILLVEDSRTQALMAKMLLQKQGFDVVVAEDGAQALAAARDQSPDVVLSDVGLPDLDGFELAQRFRDDAELGGKPVILTTATAAEADRATALEAGAYDYVEKGMKPEQLAALLRGAIEHAGG